MNSIYDELVGNGFELKLNCSHVQYIIRGETLTKASISSIVVSFFCLVTFSSINFHSFWFVKFNNRLLNVHYLPNALPKNGSGTTREFV